MNNKLIENLLFEDESTTLDFKQDQYPFAEANKDQKGELLKDILAFSNAWRRTDAFILIGVEEIKGMKNKVKGIANHLEDASLQQFVNQKTNRPIDFSYHAIEYQGKQIGVIKIPIQERPFYLLKNYGKLKNELVYIKRGSSTTIANPDEITKMGIALGKSNNFPIPMVQFAEESSQTKRGNKLNIVSTRLILPKLSEIPEHMVAGNHSIINRANSSYFKEFAIHLKYISLLQPIEFVLTNTGDALLENAVLKFSLEKNNSVIIIDSADYPEAPSKFRKIIPAISNFINRNSAEPTTIVSDRNSHWEVNIEFGNVKPKDDVWAPVFYVGSDQDCEILLEALTFANNIPEPISTLFTISIRLKEQSITIEEIVKMANEFNDS